MLPAPTRFCHSYGMLCYVCREILSSRFFFFFVISNEVVWTGVFRVSEDEWLRSTWHEAFWEPGRHHQSVFKHLNYSPYIIICTYISICLKWLGTKHKRVLWLRCNARHDVYCFWRKMHPKLKINNHMDRNISCCNTCTALKISNEFQGIRHYIVFTLKIYSVSNNFGTAAC